MDAEIDARESDHQNQGCRSGADQPAPATGEPHADECREHTVKGERKERVATWKAEGFGRRRVKECGGTLAMKIDLKNRLHHFRAADRDESQPAGAIAAQNEQ